MPQPTATPTADADVEPALSAAQQRAALIQQIQLISQRMRELDQAANRRRGQVDQVLTPRQEKRGILARIIGRGDAPEPEEAKRLREIDKQIAQAQAAASEATDELQVIAELQAELQAQIGVLQQQSPDLNRQAAVERFETARAEIEREALPKFLEAVEAFRLAYGRLAGLGAAHCELFKRYLDQFGSSPGSSLGMAYPIRDIRFALPGWGFEELLRTHPTLKGWNYIHIDLLAGNLIVSGQPRHLDAD